MSKPNFYRSKWFWSYVENSIVAIMAISGSATSALKQEFKWYPAVFSMTFAFFLLMLKIMRERSNEIALAKARGRQDKHIKIVMEEVLDNFYDRYFCTETDPLDRHLHRITLFCVNEIDAPAGKSKRLSIFARKGRFPESTCSWAIDDNNVEKCHGIAGKIYFHAHQIFRTAACPWPNDNNSVQKALFADSMEITVSEAESLNVKSTRFTGQVIWVRSQKWGVLLLDSQKNGHIVDSVEANNIIDRYVHLISRILNRVDI